MTSESLERSVPATVATEHVTPTHTPNRASAEALASSIQMNRVIGICPFSRLCY